jgi:D-alanyl-D-alanine carboxypeptidase/D-alanyl-D-alanine-endopeptidase (penicillin-binding protein 4)
MVRRSAPLALIAAMVLIPSAAGGQSSGLARSTLQRALSSDMRSEGGASGAEVVDLNTGESLFSSASRTRRIPASVEKVYTTSTALLRFGGSARLSTDVLGVGRLDGKGGWHGTIYLRGSGDPTFGSASYDHFAYGTGATVQRLALNLRNAGVRAIYGRIVGDESYFDSLRGTPATGYGFSPYLEGQLSALAYNRGLANGIGSAFQSRPALFATQRFVDALRSAGVTIPSSTPVYTGHTPVGAIRLAVVHSPRMSTLTRLTDTPSDNFFAEMLLKGLGARFGTGGSTAAGVAVVRNQIASSFGIHPRFDDGSGLSRSDATSPHEVSRALTALARNRAFVNSLSIAGETGTLKPELAGTPAQGRCRGKTGTLSDVANTVGYCTARDGHTLVFAFLMNAVDPTSGHSTEDRMVVSVEQYNG